MLEMAARVLSRFIARDYSWAIARGNVTPGLFNEGTTAQIANEDLPYDETFAIIEGCIEFCWQTLVWQALEWAGLNVCKRNLTPIRKFHGKYRTGA